MPRPPLPVGAHGRIKRTQLADGRWMALCRVRDPDGMTRRVYRYTPEHVKNDRTGAAAENALLEALTKRVYSPDVDADMRLSALWDLYRQQLVEAGRSKSTLRSYDSVAKRMVAGVGGLRIREARTQRLDEHVRWVAANHGPVTAQKVRVLLSGMFSLAVRFGALQENPVRDVAEVAGPRKKRPKSMNAETLGQLLEDVQHSTTPVNSKLTVAQFCATYDLADVVTLFAATGVRMGELCGIRWEDVHLKTKTVEITGKVVRQIGVGLVREDVTKTEAGERELPLPQFAVDMLTARKKNATGPMVFGGRTGYRNPDTVWRQWRQIRDVLELEWVTPHAFRKTVATILDDEGLTARKAADHLGHAQVSMTQDVYFGRGRTHPEAADALDNAVSKRRVKGFSQDGNTEP